HFNGKIERPRIVDGTDGLEAILVSQASGVATSASGLIAEWDFAQGIPTDIATDIGPHGFDGHCVNLPTRAMTGSRWTGAVHR
ncbi:hypothetical protein ABTD44_20910, partial [Acinetobacter baumannii]